ncbi:MAG: GSCFA domain-containing protein [Saprospiraceae bacterium]|nr:GSCFA domain-containing protein [Saprospiraceae bacterium]MCF8251483.1 GSCFA domain-containing protein [Saprospiraceae bacterium]MCF8280733.1 GSCFA domain-containing protein [Bacteroidales bacterium]MCF8313343.1 GSCFA domain-containing protein [Saprospiraceae bacterium]MCF8441837.1 GSCFA domain-containing protein [Saprospiraceae bacterium]
MTFRTVFPSFKSEVNISHTDRVLCLGSCFAEQMGGRLERLKFPMLVNPFGIVFNPISVVETLERLRSGNPFSEADLVANQGLWHSFEHHSRFSNPDKSVALEGINQSFSTAKGFLKNANRLIVTLGTAHVFVLKKTGEVVANCHKFPAGDFERRRLSVGEVVAALLPVFEKLKTELPELEIIATVSPVRHLRDGLSENQRSKATLLIALDEINQQLPYTHYFPAYELLLDDLRDYRFYAEDLAHPNQLATDYIWQYFEGAFFDEKTKALCERIGRILTALAHRPFHSQSIEHQDFLKKQVEYIKQLSAEFPSLDFERELERAGSH